MTKASPLRPKHPTKQAPMKPFLPDWTTAPPPCATMAAAMVNFALSLSNGVTPTRLPAASWSAWAGPRSSVPAASSLEVPPFLVGNGKGWLTAEYGMLPGSTNTRKPRDRGGKIDGRSVEIQRLIGRSLRAVVDLEKLGERTLWIDCDVLEADGGTRTASINGAYVALIDALAAQREADRARRRAIVRGSVAAVSVGLCDGAELLDLDYVRRQGRRRGSESGDDRRAATSSRSRPAARRRRSAALNSTDCSSWARWASTPSPEPSAPRSATIGRTHTSDTSPVTAPLHTPNPLCGIIGWSVSIPRKTIVRRAFAISLSALLIFVAGFGFTRDPENESVKADEQTLKAAHLGTDGPALLDFFRSHTLSPADRERVGRLIKQLGDDEFAVREKASADLVKLGPKVVALLRPVAKDPDCEVARRAGDCLRQLEDVEKDAAQQRPNHSGRSTTRHPQAGRRCRSPAGLSPLRRSGERGRGNRNGPRDHCGARG